MENAFTIPSIYIKTFTDIVFLSLIRVLFSWLVSIWAILLCYIILYCIILLNHWCFVEWILISLKTKGELLSAAFDFKIFYCIYVVFYCIILLPGLWFPWKSVENWSVALDFVEVNRFFLFQLFCTNWLYILYILMYIVCYNLCSDS